MGLFRKTDNKFFELLRQERFRNAIELFRGTNKKLILFKNSYVASFVPPPPPSEGYLRLTFKDFTKLGDFPNGGSVGTLVVTDVNNVSQWNQLLEDGGSAVYFTGVTINGFEVTLRGNTDLVTILGSNAGLGLQSVEVVGFPNLTDLYFDGQGYHLDEAVTSVVIDNPGSLSYVSFLENAMSTSALNSLIANLSSTAVINGTLDLGTGLVAGIPTDMVSIATLTDNGWSVNTN